MEDKSWFKAFMKLLNRNINILKKDKLYETSREILNITDDSDYVINPQMLEYDNDTRKDTKEENALIGKTRNIGKNMLRVVKNHSKYESLYNNLSNNPKFRDFFEQNGIEKEDMEEFAKHIAGFKTKSIEQHEKYNAKQRAEKQAMKQENETLKGENQILTEDNKKKDKKIERRNKKINDLIEQRDKLEEDLNHVKQQHEEEKQRTEDFYKKKTDEMTKEHEAEIAKLIEQKDKLSKKYGKKLKEIRDSMDKNQYEQEKKKITDELKTEMNKERTAYEEKIEQQEIRFKALKKSMEEAQKQALTEIDNKLKEREEEIINLNKQIEDERKQAEEDKRKIKADANRDKEEKVALAINKTKERNEKDNEKLLEETLEEFKTNQKEIYGFTPTIEAYIKKKLSAQAYSLDEDELIDKIARDIGKPGGLPKGTDPKEVAKVIYERGAEETIKHIKKIANLAILTGYNPDLYNKLPGDVAQEVQRYITEKINDDIRRKNIKYILPKDKPRWEHAMESKQLNPMLGRSAWRVN